MSSKSLCWGLVVILLGLCFSLQVSQAVAGVLLQSLFFVALAVAAWIDTDRKLIPNRLTYSLLLLGIASNLFISILAEGNVVSAIGFQASLGGAAVCFSLMLVLFLAGATGGGDVKLAAGIGAFLGPYDGLMVIGWCHLLAGFGAVVWLLSQTSLRRLTASLGGFIKAAYWARQIPAFSIRCEPLNNKRMPMAAFFALGVLMTRLGYQLW